MLVVPQITTSDTIVHFLLDQYREHAEKSRPLVVGLSGLQGSGKSYVVDKIRNTLTGAPYNFNVVTLSIDDIYYNFDTLEKLRKDHPDNILLSHRGEPGTHDVDLGGQILQSLLAGKATKIPFFDKSLHSGRGDRVPEGDWSVIQYENDHSSHSGPIADFVLFEGWCVGFRALSDDAVSQKRQNSTGTLQHHKLEHLLWINNALKRYDVLTDKFDVFVHLDAAELSFVYDWRIQQEHELIKLRGDGMTDEDVRAFIDGYMPGYELYLDGVRGGVFRQSESRTQDRQLRIVLDRDRGIKDVEITKFE